MKILAGCAGKISYPLTVVGSSMSAAVSVMSISLIITRRTVIPVLIQQAVYEFHEFSHRHPLYGFRRDAGIENLQFQIGPVLSA